MPARSNNPPGAAKSFCIVFTVDELATIPLFSALAQNELEYLAGAVEDIQLIAGEYVAHEGEGRFLAVVVDGKTEVTKLVNSVEEVIGVRLPGELGGEIPMTLGTPLPASSVPSSRRAC
ncbi:MAG: thioredoxin reductase [Mycobacterium sp.]|jgi:thioredoxin reductase (NADPH)|nr:thioredoxin reductase [Mycobacterium sp.]